MKRDEKKLRQMAQKKNPPKLRRKTRGRYILPGFILFAFLGILGCWIKSTYFARTIQFDLRKEETAKNFTFSHGSTWLQDRRGVRMECPEPCYMSGIVRAATWEEYPYVKVQVSESAVSSAWLFWVRKDSSEASGVRLINPLADDGTLIASAKTFQPWSRQMPWQGPINKVGIRIPSGAITITELILTDSLTPWEWVKFSIDEVRSIEPVLAYSINIMWGASINGWSLTTLFGFFAALSLLILIYGNSRRAGMGIAGLIIGFILIIDTPFLIGLMRTSGEASSRSAWKNSQEEEDVSRFGAEYAEIAQALRRKAPSGSRIFIPNRKREGIPTETDPMIFQLWPQFTPVPSIEQADYIILLHPIEARYDGRNGVVIIPKHDPTRAVPVVTITPEVMLLKKNDDK